MTFTTPNGIRTPDDPSAYADLIQLFGELAEDVDTKFMAKAGNPVMSSNLTTKTLISSNGGASQSSTVLQTGPVPSSAFTVYDDNAKIDNSPGRRLWIAGANGTDVAIRTRSTSDALNRVSISAKTIDINGALTVNGTLNVTGTKTVQAKYESDVWLVKNKPGPTWTQVPSAAGFTFTAPPSGAVTIGYGAQLPTWDAPAILSYTVKTGAVLTQGTTVLPVMPTSWPYATQPPPHGLGANGVVGSEQWVSVYTAYMLSGLTAGVYNVVPYYLNRNTTKDLKLFRHFFIVTPDL